LYRNGGDLEKALAQGPGVVRKRTGLSQVAREHGIKPSTLYNRMDRNGGDLEKALARGPAAVRRTGLTQAAREHRMSLSALKHRLKRNGGDLEKALAQGPPAKHKKYTLNGRKIGLKQAAEQYGIPHKTLYDRIRKGWTFEQALYTPLHTGRDDLIAPGKICKINGVEYRSEGQSGKFFMFRHVASNARETFTAAQLRDTGLIA
jgi:DNA-binding phage protein